MNVHLFGHGPSPAVATYGLRRTAIDKKFISRNFYVDDGLTSLPSTQGATDLVKSVQATLATANLRLHKVVSNSVEVMEAFPAEDRAKDVCDLDLRHGSVHSGYSGTWRQMPLPLRSLCRRSRSQGEEYCPSSTPCATRSALQYLLCSKGEKYCCSSLSIWENGQRRTIPP